MGETREPSLRLRDLKLAVELLVEAAEQEDGARERIASRYGIQKSVITNRVQRIESYFGVTLFTGPQRKSPSAAGAKMARYGSHIVDEFEHFATMLREAEARTTIASD